MVALKQRVGLFALSVIAAGSFLFCPSATGSTLPRFCRVHTAAEAAREQVGHSSALRLRLGKIVLLASRREAGPGEVVYARLANFGSHRATYGLEFAIERRGGEGWKVDTSSPKGPWPRVQGILKAGSAGRCYRFLVPNEQTGGMYRFVTHVGLEGSVERARRTARFRVT